ncbi:MAG: protein kinase [Acidiferrobacterales bacterium]
MPDASSNDVLPEGYKLSDYLIEKVLGRGGFGITYLARDTQLSSMVAIKEFFPRSVATRGDEYTIRPFTDGAEDFRWGLQEFLKEARALAKFKHNHIVRVLRFVEANGTAYMVMEYEEGESLDGYLKRSGGYLNEHMLLSVFIPVLNGLQAVHDAGLLHLDIKPDNIYLRANGKPMLIDFGSSRQAKGGSESDGKIALTPAYSAIEQYPAIGDTGPWTDVFSMGATLYRCVTGGPPTDSLKRYQAVQSNYADPLVSALDFDRPIFSSHIRESIDTAMNLMAADRPQTAGLLQRALMGQRISNGDENTKKEPSGNLRSDLILESGSPMVVVKRKKTRGFIEKLFFFVVLVPALSVFAITLLVRFGVLDEEDIFNRIDAVKKQGGLRLATSIDKLDATLYESLRISIKPRKKNVTTASIGPSEPDNMQAVEQTVYPFNINKTVTRILNGHRDEVVTLAFLRGGDALASLSAEGELRLWDTVTGLPLRRPGAAKQIIGAIDGSADGQILVWSIGDQALVYDIENEAVVAQPLQHDGNIRLISYSPRGDLLATVTGNRTLYVWDTASWNMVYKKTGMKADTNAVEFSKNGRLLALSDSNGEIKIISASNGGELVSFFGKSEGEEVLALAYSPDGRWLAGSGPEQFLKLWDTGIEVKDKILGNVPGSLNKLQFSSDSKWILATGQDADIQIWDVSKGEMAKRLKAPHKSISSFALSPKGDIIAVGGGGNKISLWR